MVSPRKTLLFALSLICLLFPLAFAQVSTSRIEGLVADTSGAVVAHVMVKAVNDETGVTYETQTSSTGSYSIPSVGPGSYTVTVSAQGFDTFSSQHNVLSVGSPLVVNVTLRIGATQEVVEVQGTYERLETTNAAVSDVISREEVKDLPLNGRNPLSLLTLEPGVVQRSTQGAGSGTHVFGSRDRAHNVTVDGIDSNESTVPNPQSNIQRLNPDNVQEFRTVTLDPTAEFGRNSGANVMVATRAGTNAIHGDLFYFNRNTDFNANEWFNNANGQPRPDLKLHQYGFDVGGPILKNKTFYFGSFQNNTILQTGPISSAFGIPLVYTAAARSGIFRYVVGAINGVNRNSGSLVDGAGNLLPGVPACAGAITTNCVASYNIFANDPLGIGGDPSVMGLINSTPMPNTFTPGVGDGLNTAGFSWNPPTKFTGPNFLVRVDHTFSDKDSVFVRYLQNHFNTTEGDFLNARPQVFPGFPPLGEVLRIGKNLAVSHRHVFTPHLVNEFTTGFNRFAFTFTFGESNPNFGNAAKLPPWSDQCVFGSFINISSPLCVSPHTQRAVTAPQFIDNVSWVHGAHTLRAGFNFRMYYHNDSRGFFGSGILAPVVFFNQSLRKGSFNNIPANIASLDKNTLQQAIVEMAGIPAGIQQGFQADFLNNSYGAGQYATVYTRAHQYDLYVQDEWRLNPTLVLTAGVRWEINPPPSDGKQSLAPNQAVDGSQGPVSFVKADGWYKNKNLGSLGPRVGIAWSPDHKTVVRAGYGWLFDTISTFQVTSIAGKIPGFILSCNNSLSATGVATPTVGCVAPGGTINRISQGFPAAVPAPTTTPLAELAPPAQPFNLAPSIGSFDPNLKNPSVHEWDLTLQRELPGHLVAEAGYVGKRGTHLYRAYDLNQINVTQPGFLDSFNIARQNIISGCKADGTGCPAGVTGQSPALLLQLMTAATLNGLSTTIFTLNNIGNLAQRIDSFAGASAITNRGFPANYFRPNPQFTQIFYFDSGGDSYYHGAFVAVRRHFEKGLDFGFTYTLSKSIDDMSVDPVGAATGGGLSTSNSRTPTDVHNFRLDRARSDFDNRHVLVGNMIYELPFGHGKTWGANWPGFLNQFLGGWSTTGIFSYQSGEPYTLNSGELTTNNTHQSSVIVVGPFDPGSLQTAANPKVQGPVYYNTGPLITNPADPHFNCVNVTGTQTFFCIPPAGQPGSGRNLAQGPNFWNLDAGISKNIKMTERFNLQFRAEFFNVLNHPNFESPRNATVGSPNITSLAFGQTCCSTSALPSSANVNALGEPNRVMQLGMKLNF